MALEHVGLSPITSIPFCHLSSFFPWPGFHRTWTRLMKYQKTQVNNDVQRIIEEWKFDTDFIAAIAQIKNRNGTVIIVPSHRISDKH